MLKNHLKIAFRNIRKFGLRSFIHVIGLSIGIAACFVVYNLVSYEYSFDTHQKDRDRIYRITSVTGNGEEEWPNPGTPIPLVEAVRNEMSAAEEVVPIFSAYRFLVESADETENFGISTKVVFADEKYFSLFEYDWLAGSPSSALDQPNAVVLTNSVAKKYFGEQPIDEILGKELVYSDTLRVMVSGIVEDVKHKTDLIFTDFISYEILLSNKEIRAKRNVDDWGSVSSNAQLFVKLAANQREKAEDELLAIKEKYVEADGNWTTNFEFESFEDLHFSDTFSGNSADRSTLNGLIIIGFFILFIACINFINLETAQAKLRSKEVGVRKTLGSSRKQLISQFLVETYVIILLAVIGAALLSQLATSYFQEVLPADFKFDYWNINNALFLIVLSIVVLLLSGFYPSMILSGYSPIKAIKEKGIGQRKSNFQYFLRKNLIVFQFGSSIAFIIVVLAINSQIDFLLNKSIGFNKEAVLHISTPFQGTLDKTKLLKNELEAIAGVEKVSLSSDMMISGSLWTSTVEHDLNGAPEEVSMQFKTADTSYLPLYEVPILAGRNYTLDQSEIVINEAALDKLGIENASEALGKQLDYDSTFLSVVGVIPNIHTQSLHQAIRPMIMGYDDRNLFTVNAKLAPKVNLKANVDAMQDAYDKIYPNETREFQFLDETVENFYLSEVRLRKVLLFSTVIAILISCLGLFGLASFTIAQRTKEISIRKVMGASLSNILVLISKEYVVLIGLAFLLAVYPAWYFISNWLNDFQFKIEMPIWIYLISGVIALLLSISIVALHTWKAANRNPAKVLKDE
ncbi:ABC transporter permease [Marivirga harenae]|uniref:ABC transporter permease n=1 Tax=Marivirga harenae TaxID=2010992 RepID=UPI0026DFE9B2|nr:ABC transporter permease [Marivirga harenae]WKV10580.1 ABC transporter permease [Marivirga harenae]